MEKKERLLNELCNVGKLENYRGSLGRILHLIHEGGCKVSTRYDVEYSNIQDSIENGTHIRVSLKNVKEPLNIIWKLLHEFGHHLSGKRKPADSDLEREILAWEYADGLLNNYPDLLALQEAYNICKEECLHTYKLAASKSA